jgi:hypothetical protein
MENGELKMADRGWRANLAILDRQFYILDVASF